MTATSPAAHLNQACFDRMALEGTLTPAETAHLARCPRCQETWVRQRAAMDAFSRAVAPRLLPVVEARLQNHRRGWIALWGLAGCAGLVLLLVGLRPAALPVGPVDDGYVGVKGAPAPLHVQAELFAQRNGAHLNWGPDVYLQPGDAIRLRVTTAARYLLVVAVDARGQSSVYFPFGGERSAPMKNTTPFELPGSVILDEAPGPERVFILGSRTPIDVAQVAPALQRMARHGAAALRQEEVLDVDPADGRTLEASDLAQTSFLLEKRTGSEKDRDP